MGWAFYFRPSVILPFLVSCSFSQSVKTPISYCPSEFDIQLAQAETTGLDLASKLRKIAIQSAKDENCSFFVASEARQVLEQVGLSYLSQKYKISLESYRKEKKKNSTVTFCLMLRGAGRNSQFEECLVEEAQFLSDSPLILLWVVYKYGLPPILEPHRPSLGKALQKFAEEGDSRAQLWVGFMHALGLGVSRNLDLAEKWWKLSRLAQAKTALGTLYFRFKNEPKKAEALLTESVKSDSEATYVLGKIYQKKKEFSRALAFFEQRVLADPRHSEAHLEIGKIYLNSEGVSRNCQKVRRHFHFAADELKDPTAQYALGMSYASKDELNPCFKYSLKRAKQYLRSSMKQGNPDARKLFESLSN